MNIHSKGDGRDKKRNKRAKVTVTGDDNVEKIEIGLKSDVDLGCGLDVKEVFVGSVVASDKIENGSLGSNVDVDLGSGLDVREVIVENVQL